MRMSIAGSKATKMAAIFKKLFLPYVSHGMTGQM